MTNSIDVTIWGWYELGIVWGSVGHVMVTDTDTGEVLLSQFPYPYGGTSLPIGPNTLLTVAQTEGTEARPPSVVFRIPIPNPDAFADMVKNQLARPVWDWDPTPPTQTHCARSAYDSIMAAQANIDPAQTYLIKDGDTNQIIPNSLWALLDNYPPAVKVLQNTANLPDSERLAYEADITRYVPFSTWHAKNQL